MNFYDLIRYKALHLKYVADNSGLTDMLAEGKVEHTVPMKNVCAMISQELFDDLNNTCALLDISKRSFIEAALIEALGKANTVMAEEGVYQALEDASEASA